MGMLDARVLNRRLHGAPVVVEKWTSGFVWAFEPIDRRSDFGDRAGIPNLHEKGVSLRRNALFVYGDMRSSFLVSYLRPQSDNRNCG